jgi:hypothetical protein
LLRVEEPPNATVFLARGGPDSIASLRSAAHRTARRFCLDGEPLLGVSVAAALDVVPDELVNRAPLLRFEHVYAPTVALLEAYNCCPPLAARTSLCGLSVPTTLSSADSSPR